MHIALLKHLCKGGVEQVADKLDAFVREPRRALRTFGTEYIGVRSSPQTTAQVLIRQKNINQFPTFDGWG